MRINIEITRTNLRQRLAMLAELTPVIGSLVGRLFAQPSDPADSRADAMRAGRADAVAYVTHYAARMAETSGNEAAQPILVMLVGMRDLFGMSPGN